MVDESRKTYEINCIETIVDSGEILWLNDKNIEAGLDYKNVREPTKKYNSNHRKHSH